MHIYFEHRGYNYPDHLILQHVDLAPYKFHLNSRSSAKLRYISIMQINLDRILEPDSGDDFTVRPSFLVETSDPKQYIVSKADIDATGMVRLMAFLRFGLLFHSLYTWAVLYRYIPHKWGMEAINLNTSPSAISMVMSYAFHWHECISIGERRFGNWKYNRYMHIHKASGDIC